MEDVIIRFSIHYLPRRSLWKHLEERVDGLALSTSFCRKASPAALDSQLDICPLTAEEGRVLALSGVLTAVRSSPLGEVVINNAWTEGLHTIFDHLTYGVTINEVRPEIQFAFVMAVDEASIIKGEQR